MSDWRVVQGDCLERLRELPEGSVDLFATSPPYAQGLEYEHGLDWHGLRELIAGVAQAAFEPCKPSSWFWVNFGETTKYERTMAELYNEAFRSAGWLMHSRRIWAKRFAQCRLTGAMQTHTIAAAEWLAEYQSELTCDCPRAVADPAACPFGFTGEGDAEDDDVCPRDKGQKTYAQCWQAAAIDSVTLDREEVRCDVDAR